MKTLVDREDLIFNPPEIDCVLSLTGLPGASSKIYDRSRYGNIGTITGATWIRLPSGLWCLSFDGVDDDVDCGDDASLRLTRWTSKLWIYRQTDSGGYERLLSRAVDGGDYDWLVQIDSLDRFHTVFKDTADVICDVKTTETCALDTWYHYVTTFDGVYLRIYLNGELKKTSADFSANTPRTTGTKVRLGRYSALYGFDGHIALPQICNRALSDLEVRNNFDREKHLFGVW